MYCLISGQLGHGRREMQSDCMDVGRGSALGLDNRNRLFHQNTNHERTLERNTSLRGR